jgi:hypothetical protein
MIDAIDAAEQMEKADANDPIEPIDSADPTDPIDRTEPREPIDSSESSDHSDHFELSGAAGTSLTLTRNDGGAGDTKSRRHQVADTKGYKRRGTPVPARSTVSSMAVGVS